MIVVACPTAIAWSHDIYLRDLTWRWKSSVCQRRRRGRSRYGHEDLVGWIITFRVLAAAWARVEDRQKRVKHSNQMRTPTCGWGGRCLSYRVVGNRVTEAQPARLSEMTSRSQIGRYVPRWRGPNLPSHWQRSVRSRNGCPGPERSCRSWRWKKTSRSVQIDPRAQPYLVRQLSVYWSDSSYRGYDQTSIFVRRGVRMAHETQGSS